MLSAITRIFKLDLADKLGIRRKPLVIQLPITGKCNSRCVTCNVWKQDMHNDIDPDKLGKVLSHPYFSAVRSVGVNGGETVLHRQFEKVIDTLFLLPNLKDITLISNGLLTNILLEKLEVAHTKCKEHGVHLALVFSVDSIGETHDIVRGVPNAFNKTSATVLEVLKDKSRYCDSFRLGCTISRYNVYELFKVESFADEHNVDVEYHLAVPNKRIHTFNDAERYSVLFDEKAKLMAIEFFQSRMSKAKNIGDKMRYYMQILYLQNGGKGRLSTCNFRYRDITIDENMEFYLCATASDSLGNIHDEGVENVTSKERFRKAEKQVFANCDTCIHYCWSPTIKGVFVIALEKLRLLWRSKMF